MKIKTSFSRHLFNVINYTVLTAFAVLCLLPVLHVLASSFSDPNWLNTKAGLVLWPKGLNVEGYKMVFANTELVHSYINTILYVASATVIGMLITLVGGYVLSKKNLLWGDTIMMLISVTMLFSGGIIPSYIIMEKLNLLDTPWAVILPNCVTTFNLIVMRTGFASIPPELEESARLDGAGELTIIFRVLLPLVKATAATIALYYIVMHWNSWFQAAMYLQNRKLYPLQLIMREILIVNDTSSATQMANNAMANMDVYKQLVKYCAIIVSSAPLTCVYPFVMKYFKSGVMIGSIKG